MWFAFKLVSLNHWKQRMLRIVIHLSVVICFQISIFEPLETTEWNKYTKQIQLWFAFKLVSLNHWKQLQNSARNSNGVVICFQISIFEPLETTLGWRILTPLSLWFAFKLVSLNHWKQLYHDKEHIYQLWFAFKLVSLNHWKQLQCIRQTQGRSCDLLSN